MPAIPTKMSPLGTSQMRVSFVCPFCGEESQVVVDKEKYQSWIEGKGYVQNVFPELSAAERETLINGSHEACFDKAFGNDD